jgi:signal transduction histidine kinase/DNA-binding response OmpR family regulator/ligand-binding sensor domain-containing protein
MMAFGIFTCLHAFSQNKYESITTADGLSQGMVFDMLQDKDGFIWIATKDALNRYDGYEFKVFANDPYNNFSISNNSVVRLFEDSKGRIWAGTENAGVNIYDKKKAVFYRLQSSPSNPNSISGNNIRAIEELPDGRIILAIVGNGINILTLPDDVTSKNAVIGVERIKMPNNTEVYGMGKDNNQRIFIGGMDGAVYAFDTKKNSFNALPLGKLYNNGYLAEDGTVMINHNLFLDDGKRITPLFDTSKIKEGNLIYRPNSALWEYHHRELYFYDISRWGPDKMPNWNEKLPIDQSTRIIYPFTIDRSGLVWTGTVGYGLRKYNTIESRFKTLAKGNSIRLIKPFSDKEIFCVDYGYPWMKITDDELVDENVFKIIPSVSQIDNIIISKSKDFYIKSDQKGYFRYNPTNNKLIALPGINANQTFGKKQPFIEDNQHCIWFPGLDGNITLFNTQTGSLDSFTINQNGSKLLCTALHEDKGDVFWVGTETGFAKVKIRRDQLSLSEVNWFYNDPSDRNSLSYGHVTCFLDDPADPDKYLWISTKGGGLNRLDKVTGDFLHLAVNDGLPDNVVYGTLSDGAGNIWGSTNKGIFCLMMQSKKTNADFNFRNFTKKEGLQDDEFNTGAYAKMPDGRLAFGGVNGLNIFDPKYVLQSGFEPNVFITKILVGNNPVSPNDKTGVLNESIEKAKSITLTHLQDILTLEFASLDFSNPGQNKYRYQLVGIDNDWVQSDTRRSATYLHLPDGKYVFKVQGSNSEGIWSDKTTELEIIVLPPWWATWWAYLVYALIIGYIIKTYLQYRLNKTKIESQLILEQNEAKRVKELDTVKTQLYTNITHEFRTPLTVILGMVQQIKSGTNEHFENGLDMIERNGKNLLNLVNEMLDLSKLEAGKMQLNLVKGDVIQFLRYIVESFHSMAESQGKQMHYLASLDSMFTSYDAEKLRQIISNLLSNALKFTEEKGNIYISISTLDVEKETDSKQLVIKIKDTGSGIPEDQIIHIFDRFYQADISHTRKAEGTGIGLALTKELVQLMSGSIEAKSPPVGARKGTEFTVILPVKSAVGSDEKFLTDTLDPTPSSPYTFSEKTNKVLEIESHPTNKSDLILLVEDNADVVAYTASCLPEYRLAVGKDGREGFDIACQLIPDLIITDVMMPFVDGFEMCKKLRQDERTSHIPIIMLTAKADMESKLEGFEHGADAYLEKPFYKEELKLRIKKLLEQRKLLQNVYSKLAGFNNMLANTSIEDDEGSIGYITKEIPVLEDAFVKKVRMEIASHMGNENFSVEELAKNIFMSHSQLNRKLSALTGHSPNHFIRIMRMQKACDLLKNTDDSIANISEICGYSDASYFGKVFKQEYGMTPQEWKLANR